ncbi:MAG TPA: TonB-dependent receptor [Bacteroides sp.]|nr:TonB-dependent receptor [Bacteroides sp.]
MYLNFLLEGFYTHLNDPFANHYSQPDEDGIVIYTRINAEKGASVRGLNFELNLVPAEDLTLKTGFTVQSSLYEKVQEFDEKRFLRSPGDYGYMALDWQSVGNFGFSSTANYTGKMLVPYFGVDQAEPNQGELRVSQRFLEMGLKLRYDIRLNGATLRLYTGMKNIFNSYQSDFDTGIGRDPGYMYGPLNPRTVYVGLKIGNQLK